MNIPLINSPGQFLTETDLTEIEAACLKDGNLQAVPRSTYDQFDRNTIGYFAMVHGFYSLPTTELISFFTLAMEHFGISPEDCLEIGAGNGALGRALKITQVDNYLQERPEIKEFYDLTGQPTIKYGPGVIKMEANEAIEKFKPKWIFGAWITDMSVNPAGPNESKFFDHGATVYFHIGNLRIHNDKQIKKIFEYDELMARGLISRSAHTAKDVMWIFKKR